MWYVGSRSGRRNIRFLSKRNIWTCNQLRNRLWLLWPKFSDMRLPHRLALVLMPVLVQVNASSNTHRAWTFSSKRYRYKWGTMAKNPRLTWYIAFVIGRHARKVIDQVLQRHGFPGSAPSQDADGLVFLGGLQILKCVLSRGVNVRRYVFWIGGFE